MIWILAVLSGIFYRAGGTGGKWYLNTKVRDLGCPLCALAVLYIKYGFHIAMIPTFFVMWAALSTYFKGDKPDVLWYHWLIVGLAMGLSLFPYAWANGLWPMFWFRTIILIATITISSEAIDEVNFEEFTRGFLFTGSMIFL